MSEISSATPSLISLAGPVGLDTCSLPSPPELPNGRLLSLPYELRLQIWEVCFDHQHILDLRLYCRPRRLTSHATEAPDTIGFLHSEVKDSFSAPLVSQDDKPLYIGDLKQKAPTCYDRFHHFTGQKSSWGSMSLLYTKRQVHQEVKPVLFKRQDWMIENGELPLRRYCDRDHTYSRCTHHGYHSVHLTLQSHLPPSGNHSYGFYSTIFLSLFNLRFFWKMRIEIELEDERDMHLIDWICKTLIKTLSIADAHAHAHNNTTVAMRYPGQYFTPEFRQERWTSRHRREFMDATWMRFQQPGLVIAWATSADQQQQPVGGFYTLGERTSFTLISPVETRRRDGAEVPLTKVCIGDNTDFQGNRFDDMGHELA